MDDLDIYCANQPDDSMNISFDDDKVFIMCLSPTADVALDEAKVTRLRDALTEWLEGRP